MSAARKARRSKMTKNLFSKRQSRTRFRLTSHGTRPRLSIFRSGKHIYAQVIDDTTAATVASASTNEKDGKEAKSWNVDAASSVGKKIAERAKAAGVTQVMFDRGGYIYHGRIKALAEAAREGGLEF
jgi:large subunit ribosomal protein L18